MANGKDAPTDEQAGHNTADESTLSRRRLLQAAGVGMVGSGFLIGTGSAAESPDRLEVVAHHGSEVEYTFGCAGQIEPVSTNSFVSTESDEDGLTENDDGTWTATGYTADGYGDAFELSGDVISFQPESGEYTLYLNGSRIAREELVQVPTSRLEIETPADGSVEYAFSATGEVTKVLDNGDNAAEAKNDAVVQNADGTWTAKGLTGNGYGDTYDFEGSITDFSPADGSFSLYLDGQEVTTYELTGEEPPVDREHSYSFVGTGDSWADYYLEVEDNANMVATTLDGAVIEDDFHWVSDDGTKAAGRVDPGERHAYEFDNLVLDVTIEGQADAFVDGRTSNLEYYPQPGATGDSWKGGFPWQDGGEGTTASGQEPIGGGANYGNVVRQSDADVVVRTRSELASALSSASAGDVVFVPGDEQINLGNRRYDVPNGVTLASSRGVKGSSGALLYTGYEPWKLLVVGGSGRVTGLRLRGAHPGDDTGGDTASVGVQTFGAAEVDNCDIWGFTYAAVRAASGDGAHVHHNVIRENNRGGYGYGVAAESGTPLAEYNYFNYNRHSMKTAGKNPGYIARYNHFGPKTTSGVIDAHDPAGVKYEVHNNIVEAVTTPGGERKPSVLIRGVPDDVYEVHDNWFWNPREPLDSPNGWTDEAITQPREDEWTNVTWWDNYYGESANVSYADIIPGYDGWRSP